MFSEVGNDWDNAVGNDWDNVVGTVFHGLDFGHHFLLRYASLVLYTGGVRQIVESVDDTWTRATSHGNRRSNNSVPRNGTSQRSKSGPVIRESNGEDAAFGYYFSKPEEDGDVGGNIREHHHRRRVQHKQHKHPVEMSSEQEHHPVRGVEGCKEGRGSRSRLPERVNRWRQMKLHELMAKLEDSSVSPQCDWNCFNECCYWLDAMCGKKRSIFFFCSGWRNGAKFL